MATYKTRVVKNDQETWDGECACGFTSREWPQRKFAAARIAEHTVEHETGTAMRDLSAFRVEHGLESDGVIDFGDSK